MKYILGFFVATFLLPTQIWAVSNFSDVTIRTNAQNRTFDSIGENKWIKATCNVGETLIAAYGKTEGSFFTKAVVHKGISGLGREASVRFERLFTQADYVMLSAGGVPSPITKQVVALAHCVPGINVRFYGAVGDGVTDDTAAILAAINDTPLDGTLYLPVGNYVVSGELPITKRIKVHGDGPSTQLFQSNTGTSLFVLSARGIQMADMYLGSASTLPDTALMSLQRAHYAEIEDIIMHGGYYGLWLHGSLVGRFTNIRSSANIAVSYFANALSSQNQVWIRTERDSPNLVSTNANTFINPMLEGGQTCFHHTDFAGQGNLTILGGVMQGCQVVGLKVEGNAGYVNVYGTHFENNFTAFGALDVETDTSFGLNLNGIFSVGKLHFKNIGSDHAIMNSMVNRVEIDSGIKRTMMLGSKHSNTAPGSQIIDNSGGHSAYIMNGVIQSLLSPATTTIGLGTAGPVINSSGFPASLEVNGPAVIQGGVTP